MNQRIKAKMMKLINDGHVTMDQLVDKLKMPYDTIDMLVTHLAGDNLLSGCGCGKEGCGEGDLKITPECKKDIQVDGIRKVLNTHEDKAQKQRDHLMDEIVKQVCDNMDQLEITRIPNEWRAAGYHEIMIVSVIDMVVEMITTNDIIPLSLGQAAIVRLVQLVQGRDVTNYEELQEAFKEHEKLIVDEQDQKTQEDKEGWED